MKDILKNSQCTYQGLSDRKSTRYGNSFTVIEEKKIV
jgi:hypothetical protein